MKLSIIVPVYNVEKYIEECLNSIYNQDLDNFEVLCIDDKGNDNSVSVIKKYIKRNKITNLTIVSHKENKGLSEARNTGINLSKGTYLCFLDSDDYFAPKGIKKLLNQAIKNNLDIIEGKMEEICETDCNIKLEANTKYTIDQKIIDGDSYFANLCKNNLYLPISPIRLYKKSLLLNKCYFTPGIKFEDEEFSPRAIISAKKVQYLDVPFYIYRRRDDSITTSMVKDIKWVESYLVVIEKLTNFLTQIKDKKSYPFLKNRIGLITLSLLKNPIAYKASKEQVKEIVKIVKNNKLYKIPMQSSNIFVKMQGFLMRFPNLFVKIYTMRREES